jgi:lauroyl/myristoyl acyltransferase
LAGSGRLSYLAYRTAALAARAVPAPVAAVAARGLGLVLSQTMRGRRSMLERHLRRVLGPDVPAAAVEREARRAFDSYARYWLELFRLPAYTRADLDAGFTSDGFEHIDEALAAGKGAIVALPHLGGWDFAGAWVGVNGYRITVVVEPVEPRQLFEWFVEVRRALGMTIVPLGPEAGGALLRALRANEIVCLLSDRDIGGGGVEVEFFGERTTLPGGAATLALRTGAALMPVAAYFEGRHGHHAVIGPPLSCERTGKLRDDVTRVTQALARELEDLIRRAPEQWHLFQPNWPSDRRPSDRRPSDRRQSDRGDRAPAQE